MDVLVQEVLKQIESAGNAEDLDRFIWKVGFLIVRARDSQYRSGFEEIDKISVSPEDGQALKKALIDALDRNQEAWFVQQILDCLIMTYDENLKPLYVSYLDRYLQQLKNCNGVVYSTLNGLDRIGEEVYEFDAHGSSQSVVQVDKNIRQAHRYLQKLGIAFHW